MGYGSSIAEAIARMGNAQAAGAQRKGELYSGLAQNLGQIPMQIYGMQQQQQQNQASNALIGQRLEAGKMDLAERQREEKIAQDVRSILASGGTDNDVLEYLKVNDPKAFQTAQRLLQEQGIAQLNLMEGRPGALPAEVPLPATPDEPVTPLSAHEAPHPEVNIPGLGSVRPRTQNEVTQRLLAQKQAEARIRREENTYDINGMRLPSQAIGPVITGQTAIHRQKDQQEFTAGENEKNRAARLKSASIAANRPARKRLQLITTKDDKGNQVQRFVSAEEGKDYAPGDTADMRNKAAARVLVGESIGAIEDISRRVITEKAAIIQRAKASGRAMEAFFANDPDYRVYQDARMALAGNLAVAQQGSRPSDADIKAIWLPLVPDAFKDTRDSMDMKWQLIKKLSHVDDVGSGGLESGSQNANPQAEALRKEYNY